MCPDREPSGWNVLAAQNYVSNANRSYGLTCCSKVLHIATTYKPIKVGGVQIPRCRQFCQLFLGLHRSILQQTCWIKTCKEVFFSHFIVLIHMLLRFNQKKICTGVAHVEYTPTFQTCFLVTCWECSLLLLIYCPLFILLSPCLLIWGRHMLHWKKWNLDPDWLHTAN